MKNINLKLAAFAMIGLAVSSAQAATLDVCTSGCAYSLPSQAYNAAAAGDIIQIQPGTYTDCIYILKNNLTITGVNGMPKMVNKVCGQKGILVTAAQNLTIKNLELSGATDNENYAGIRHDAAGFNLTLDNVYIHDNDDGILASSSGDTITILNSKFENNGMNASTGMAHNLYIGNAALITFRNSQSVSAKLEGHDFKSRAARTEIYSSTIASLAGVDSRLIDLSNGGTLIVQDSVLEKGPNSANTDMIAFAPEGLGSNRTHSVTMTGNKIIGDRSPTDLIYFFNSTPPMDISGNTLVAIRTISNVAGVGTNSIFSSRSAAGYAAYPSLPAPGGVTSAPPTTTTTSTTTTTTMVTVPAGDSQPPTASIANPLNGAIVARRSIVNISATATDNVKVTKVVFNVNGAAQCTVTAAPYNCSFRTSNNRGKVYKLEAVAYDAAGNVGRSAIVSIRNQ